jgi:hypothetical protein
MKTYMFLAKKDIKYPNFEVLTMEESTGLILINFSFLSKIKPMYNVQMPYIG